MAETAQDHGRRGRHREPELAHRIQVFKFSGRPDQRLAQRVSRPAHQAGAGASAAGDLVLHVSCDFLRRRYSPAQNKRRQAARLRSLYDAFPHSIAGPIVRYGDIAGQIAHRAITTAGFAEGIRRFIIGLAKKMLVANTVAVAADAIFAVPGRELNFSLAWLGVACYTLQIYFDFSGYSDMAIGLAKLFGIDFLENFNHPYTARSITEFWRRWHISLSSWFRDYLYIPLGGNRCGRVRNYFNLVIVFFLCGLWHGASWTFAAWGLFHGAFLVLERMKAGRMIDSLWSPVRHLYTLLVVSTGWVLFRADTVPQAEAFLKAMAGLGSGAGLEYHVGLYVDSQLVLALIAGAIGSAPLLPLLVRARDGAVAGGPRAPRSALNAGFALADVAGHSLLLLASSMLLAAGTHNPFIYFRF